ncbi:ABC transporter permease [Lichenifustis flavocetrariae]|uniref:ABC transporter permease n=1 Tax=Lichenifustis flavocetrariae TaxID=2949735 RepID=A0AA41Z8M5_9HYPH|nr:ABC transporter permease [Lichenifustis flavocetrariae]MCW6512340.1 ABC transporter permease [Lichenifustis flavocetrariae]
MTLALPHAGTAPSVKRAVRRADRPARRAAFLLSLPLLAFLAIAFVVPIAALFTTAVDNPETRSVLPDTLRALAAEPSAAVPGEPVFAELAHDLARAGKARTAALLGKRLNYEIPGMRSIVMAGSRLAAASSQGPWRQKFCDSDPAWGDPALWAAIRRNGARLTPYYMLTAVDLQQTPSGGLAPVAPEQRIFLDILGRTLLVAATVTLLTLFLGYPVAYALTLAPPLLGAIMMLCILLPLWTSLLVRTTAWVVLLQSNGIINDLLIGMGLISKRLQLIFTRFGTVAAMTHIQLPFTILPIASVMRTIPVAQLRAARSLGAPPMSAFWRIYVPQTLPGVMAGCLITFILSLGYYITPALVGGPTDQMVSNFISVYINRDLNWGLASALGVVLLAVTLLIYGLFLRIVGADKLRLG